MSEIKDFIGIFDNAIDPALCDEMVEFYHYGESLGCTVNRQAHEHVAPFNKQNNMYYFENQSNNSVFTTGVKKLAPFTQAVWHCYAQYEAVYGALSAIGKRSIDSSIKIQHTKPTEGYHVWHCEHADISSGRRSLLVMAYLNDVEEGGETEFLYQKVRIKPVKGRLIMAPSAFTHTHRGNPPLSGDKYVIGSWLSFCE